MVDQSATLKPMEAATQYRRFETIPDYVYPKTKVPADLDDALRMMREVNTGEIDIGNQLRIREAELQLDPLGRDPAEYDRWKRSAFRARRLLVFQRMLLKDWIQTEKTRLKQHQAESNAKPVEGFTEKQAKSLRREVTFLRHCLAEIFSVFIDDFEGKEINQESLAQLKDKLTRLKDTVPATSSPEKVATPKPKPVRTAA